MNKERIPVNRSDADVPPEKDAWEEHRKKDTLNGKPPPAAMAPVHASSPANWRESESKVVEAARRAVRDAKTLSPELMKTMNKPGEAAE